MAAVGLVTGQFVALVWDGGAVPAAVAAVTAGPALSMWHRRLGTLLSLLAVAALVGTTQARWLEAAREVRAAQLGGGPAELHGRIVALRSHRARSGTPAVTLDLLLTEASPPVRAHERVRVTIWSTLRAWQVGDTVHGRVAGLRAPRGFCNSGEDGYARAMWRRDVVATASVGRDRGWSVVAASRRWRDLDAALDAVRRAIARHLAHAVADPPARAVLAALIYGDQSDVPEELRRAYARTGTTHVLSVSGLHIAIVAMTCFALLRRLLAHWSWLALRVRVVRPAAVLAVLPATLYALLSGGAVATVRALVMGCLALGGTVLLRRTEVWSALAAAALVLCLAEPGVAGEASFQLSFAAVIGLVVAGRRWEERRRSSASRWLDPVHPVGRWTGKAAGAVVAALAAGLVTGPLTAYHFGSVATLGVLANLVVVPLVGCGALLAALAGTALLPISSRSAELLFWLGSGCVIPADALVCWLATVPGCAIDVSLASAVEVGCVLTPLATLVAPAGSVRRSLLVLSCALLATRVCESVAGAVRPLLEVRFLDVGQGDAILTRLTGRSSALLVDAGGLGGTVDPGARVVLPALRRAGIQTLDAAAMTHPDFDHYGGLAAVFAGLPVREFWSNGRTARSSSFASLTTSLAARRSLCRTVWAGSPGLRAGGATIDVLHPPSGLRAASENDASLVLQVTYGASRVLLTGDLQGPGESTLLRGAAGIAATIVKVPHHGSRTSSTRALVAQALPGLAVAQLGASNRFHFPAAEVRERWRRGGAQWLETARAGEVVVRSDGQIERVATCRQEAAGEPGDGLPSAAAEGDDALVTDLVAAARASWRRALSIWLKRNDSS